MKSGLQRQVLQLYKDVLKEIKHKPTVFFFIKFKNKLNEIDISICTFILCQE